MSVVNVLGVLSAYATKGAIGSCTLALCTRTRSLTLVGYVPMKLRMILYFSLG
jgi:hypothetical protein